jgi:hypothetical protein
VDLFNDRVYLSSLVLDSLELFHPMYNVYDFEVV